jgi:PTH1 family peptidyl-tRNA hydrolase
MVLDVLANELGVGFKTHKARAMVAEARVRPGGAKVILAKPSSFMNLSGQPVAALASFYDIPPERIVAVHDELDIPFDDVRIKFAGGHGGHNGLRDMMAALDSRDFVRLRVGIGRPQGRQDAAEFVLRNFSSAERKTLPHVLQSASDAIVSIADEGYLAAQQRVNAPRLD